MKVLTGAAALLTAMGLVAWTGLARAQSHQGQHQEMNEHQEMGEGHEMMGHSHEACERHHGQVAMTEGHHFETVFTPQGMAVYIYNEQQEPELVRKAEGTVDLKFENGPSRTLKLQEADADPDTPTVYFCPMDPDVVQMEPGVCPKCGMKLYAQNRLVAMTDLSGVKPGTMKAVVKLHGLKGDEKETTFTETFDGFAAMGEHHDMDHGDVDHGDVDHGDMDHGSMGSHH